MSDFVTAAVIREALASIVREMRRSMVRSSYSSIIYEGYDFSCVLVDARGQLIAQSGEDHPFHVIPVAASVERLLQKHERIGESDLFLHNDPYTGGTHLNDVAVVWPVFEAGRLLLFVVIRSHWADIGGMTPGSLSGAAREILHEGLRLDNVRIDKSGDSELMRMIFDNVRVSNEAIADFHAVLGICRVAERRVRALLARYTTTTVLSAIGDLLDASEKRMRAALAGLPDGVYRHIAYLDGNSAEHFPLHVRVSLTVEGEHVHADFTGTSPQVAAPLNAGPAIGPTSMLTIVKSFLDPAGVINSGTLRPIRVTVPERTILNARYPAPCGGLNEVRFAADAAVMGALAKIIPERLTGDVRGTSNHTYIGGHDPRRNRSFIFYEYPSGGTGGWADADGNHAVRAFNEGENVSIQSAEMVEVLYPLRILQNEIRPDSGGPGASRGGLGLVRQVEVLADGLRYSLLSDRNLMPPGGVNGGRSGAPNRYEVLRAGAACEVSEFPGKVANFPLQRGDVVCMMSSGGGGFGPPAGRPLARVREDLIDGLVTPAGLAAYAASLGPDGEVVRRGDAVPDRTVQVRFAPFPSPVHCTLSGSLARALGIAPGRIVELYASTGPAVRLWVQSLTDADGAEVCVSDTLTDILTHGRPQLRPLDSHFSPETRNSAT
ncbi:MAG: hydantoinase B/oxoprolinase family protein [Burkholderiales bacterium]|nr:hydantoinase B/oxoprolinase family protein [Burkholderiales bacterium]